MNGACAFDDTTMLLAAYLRSGRPKTDADTLLHTPQRRRLESHALRGTLVLAQGNAP